MPAPERIKNLAVFLEGDPNGNAGIQVVGDVDTADGTAVDAPLVAQEGVATPALLFFQAFRKITVFVTLLSPGWVCTDQGSCF